jgi:hypothetical protein
MLTKLLKYEFKSTYLKFLSAFAVYVVMSGILLTFFRFNVGLTIGLISVGVIALWVMMIVNIVQRYNSNLYGSEGYLMFSLPVSGRKLLFSKLIPAFIWVVGLGIISVASAFVVACAYGDIPSISNVISLMLSRLDLMIPQLCESVVAIVMTIIAIFFAITVSKLPLWRKFGVLMGFVAYFAVDTIHSVPSFILRAINAGTAIAGSPQAYHVTSAINSGAALGSNLQTYQVTSANSGYSLLPVITTGNMVFNMVQIGFDVLLCVGVFFATTWLMDKKTSLR